MKEVNSSRQKELNANLQKLQKKELVGQLKNVDVVNAIGTQSMLVLTILEKIKEMKLKLSQTNGTVL